MLDVPIGGRFRGQLLGKVSLLCVVWILGHAFLHLLLCASGQKPTVSLVDVHGLSSLGPGLFGVIPGEAVHLALGVPLPFVLGAADLLKVDRVDVLEDLPEGPRALDSVELRVIADHDQ